MARTLNPEKEVVCSTYDVWSDYARWAHLAKLNKLMLQAFRGNEARAVRALLAAGASLRILAHEVVVSARAIPVHDDGVVKDQDREDSIKELEAEIQSDCRLIENFLTVVSRLDSDHYKRLKFFNASSKNTAVKNEFVGAVCAMLSTMPSHLLPTFYRILAKTRVARYRQIGAATHETRCACFFRDLSKGRSVEGNPYAAISVRLASIGAGVSVR